MAFGTTQKPFFIFRNKIANLDVEPRLFNYAQAPVARQRLKEIVDFQMAMPPPLSPKRTFEYPMDWLLENALI